MGKVGVSEPRMPPDSDSARFQLKLSSSIGGETEFLVREAGKTKLLSIF